MKRKENELIGLGTTTPIRACRVAEGRAEGMKEPGPKAVPWPKGMASEGGERKTDIQLIVLLLLPHHLNRKIVRSYSPGVIREAPMPGLPDT